MNLTARQKKKMGGALMMGFGILVLALLVGLVYDYARYQNNENALSLGFLIFLLYLPFHFGWRLYRRGRSEGLTLTAPLPPGRELTLAVKIGLPEYRALLYHQTLRNLWIIYLLVIGALMVGAMVVDPPKELSITMLFPLFILSIPVTVYFQATKNYESTKTLKEKMVFRVNAETIHISGQTFTSAEAWESLHRVQETKQWFLLYTGPQAAILVPKRCFDSAADIALFRDFAVNAEGVLKELG